MLRKDTLNILKNRNSKNLRPLYWISQLQFEKRLKKTKKLIKIWLYHSKRYQEIRIKLKNLPDPRYYYKKYRPAHRLYKHIKLRYKLFNFFKIRKLKIFKDYFSLRKSFLFESHFKNIRSKTKRLKKLIFRNFFRFKGLVKYLKRKYLGRKRRLKRFSKKNSANKIIFNRMQARNKRKMKVRLRKRYLRRNFNKKFKMKINFKPVRYYIKKRIEEKNEYFKFKKDSVDITAKNKIIKKMMFLFEIEEKKKKKSILDGERLFGNIAFYNIWITFFHRYNLKKLKKTFSENMFKNLSKFLNHWKNNISENTFLIYYFYNFVNFRSIYLKSEKNNFRVLGQKNNFTLVSISYKNIALLVHYLKNFNIFLKKNFFNNYVKLQKVHKPVEKNLNDKKKLIKILLKEKYDTEDILSTFQRQVFFSRKEKLLAKLKQKKFVFFVNKALRDYIRKKNKIKITTEIELAELEMKKEYMEENYGIINEEIKFQKIKEAVYVNLRNKLAYFRNNLIIKKRNKNYNVFKQYNKKIYKSKELIYYKSFYTWIFIKNLFNKTIYKKLFNPYNVWIFFFNYALNYYIFSKLYFIFLNYFFFILFNKFIKITNIIRVKKLELCYDFIKLQDNSRYHLGIRPHTFVTTFNRRVRKGFLLGKS